MKRIESFFEKGLSFFVPFLGLVWFFKKRYRLINMVGFIVNLIFCCCTLYFCLKWFSLIAPHFSYIGQRPICNLREERAMHFGSFVFIFCYRCTFLIVGSFVTFFLCYFRKIKISWYFIIISMILIFPCFLDGVIQRATEYTSTNFLRSITGLSAGIGIGYIAYTPFKKWNLFL